MESVRNKILSRCNLGAPEIGGGGLDDDLLDEDKICDDVSTAVAKVSPSDGNQMRGLYTPNHGDVLPGVTRAIITYTVSLATKDVLLASDDVLPCVTGAVSLALDNNVSKGSPADTTDIGAQGSNNTIGSNDSSDPAADGHDTPAPPAGKARVTSPSSAVENMVDVHASRRENMQADARGSMGGSRQPAQVAGESRMLYEMGDVRHGTQSAQLVSNGWAGRADVFGGGVGGHAAFGMGVSAAGMAHAHVHGQMEKHGEKGMHPQMARVGGAGHPFAAGHGVFDDGMTIHMCVHVCVCVFADGPTHVRCARSWRAVSVLSNSV